MSIDELTKIARDTFYITEYEFRTRRSQAAFMARMCVMKHLHDSGYNFSHIGRMLDRDRVTVMHAIEQYDNLYSIDKSFRKLANMFKQKVKEANIKL